MQTENRHLFVSYARRDAAWLERVKVHLEPLVQHGTLDLWDDSRIDPGRPWREEIASAIARARIVILLVSADFLASAFIVDHELPHILQRAADGSLWVIPVIVGPCRIDEHDDLARYQGVNGSDEPLSALPYADAESILVRLARGVDKLLRSSEPEFHPHATSDGPREPTTSSLSAIVQRPLNLGFDGSAPRGLPFGWFDSFGYVSAVSTDYDIRLVPRSGQPSDGMCAVLERTAARGREFGSIMQRCPARFLAGKAVRFDGELRAKGLTGWAGLWLRADSAARPNLFFDNMFRKRIVGTVDWQRYSIDAQLPTETEWLNYGIVLSGSGAVYADNLRLRVWTEDDRWEDI